MISNQICELPDSYKPSEDEEFMCDRQREYFRRKLEEWKRNIQTTNEEALKYLKEEYKDSGTDLADQASSATDLAYELRSKDRARKLISKIDEALERINAGTYGYCIETGEPISLQRLEARPVAMLSIEAQKRHEKREKVRKD